MGINNSKSAVRDAATNALVRDDKSATLEPGIPPPPLGGIARVQKPASPP